MAKKKPAAKMPVKKTSTKNAVKKSVAKAPVKKVVQMTKKNAPKKEATKKNVAKKTPQKSAAKSIKSVVVKAATKIIAKAKPLSKEQIKKSKDKDKSLIAKEAKEKARLEKEKAQERAAIAKQKEKQAKERAKDKALVAKQKEKEAVEKAKQKEVEKKKKEEEKLKLKAEKERAKSEKTSKKKSKIMDEDEEDFDDLELGPDDEPVFGEERQAKKTEDDDFDEFEEEYKKSKATKKSGKKAYEEDESIDLFPTKSAKKYSNAVLADIENNIADEIAQLREHFNWKEIAAAIGSMDFFIDPKNDECIEKGCDNIRTTQSYCRLHYLRNWKTVQKKREILKEGKLQEYIEELISKYPPKYIEALLSDLSDDKEFYRVLNELNITSEFDFEEDEFENAADDDDTDDDIAIESISSSLRYEDE